MAKNIISNTTSQDNFATEKVNVISNCLLGDYVDEKYFISDEIKKELINVKKVKKSVYKNSVFCSSFIAGYGDVVFEVTFQKNSVRNVAMAELFVLENEYKINGYIQNTIRTKVAEYADGIENFIEKAYNFFNISLTDSDGGKLYNLKEDISVNAYINAKRNFNLNMAKLTSKNYNKLYKNYVTARLKKLKDMENNPFARAVLDKFNGEYSKIEKYFLKGNNYKALSELLDKSIEDCSGINPNLKQQEKEVMEQLTPIVDDFSRQADDIYTHYEARAEHAMSNGERELLEAIQNGTARNATVTSENDVRTNREHVSDDSTFTNSDGTISTGGVQSAANGSGRIAKNGGSGGNLGGDSFQQSENSGGPLISDDNHDPEKMYAQNGKVTNLLHTEFKGNAGNADVNQYKVDEKVFTGRGREALTGPNEEIQTR